MTKKVKDMIVRQIPYTYIAKQFLPRSQGEDDWPIGVRRSKLKDDVKLAPYVIGEPTADMVVNGGDWVLTNHKGDTIICSAEDFKHEYVEDSQHDHCY